MNLRVSHIVVCHANTDKLLRQKNKMIRFFFYLKFFTKRLSFHWWNWCCIRCCGRCCCLVALALLSRNSCSLHLWIYSCPLEHVIQTLYAPRLKLHWKYYRVSKHRFSSLSLFFIKWRMQIERRTKRTNVNPPNECMFNMANKWWIIKLTLLKRHPGTLLVWSLSTSIYDCFVRVFRV